MSRNKTNGNEAAGERKFDPAGWQWQEGGRIYQLEELSREDLLQVACAGH